MRIEKLSTAVKNGLPYMTKFLTHKKEKFVYQLFKSCVVYENKDIATPYPFGFEQSYYARDYGTGRLITQLDKIDEPLDVINFSILKQLEDCNFLEFSKSKSLNMDFFRQFPFLRRDGLQVEFELPFLMYNFRHAYASIYLCNKFIHMAFEREGMMLSPIIQKEKEGLLMTDNHVTIGTTEQSQIFGVYNNLRQRLPDILAPACNSPFYDVKSFRNLTLERIHSQPRVGSNTKSLKRHKQESNKNRIDEEDTFKIEVSSNDWRNHGLIYDWRSFAAPIGNVPGSVIMPAKKSITKLPRKKTKEETDVKLSEEEDEEAAYLLTIEEHEGGKIKITGASAIEKYVPIEAVPKSLDVIIKPYPMPGRIELTVPDGMTCSDDIMINVISAMIAATNPIEIPRMPFSLEQALLTGRKINAITTGKTYSEIPNETVIGEWKSLSEGQRKNLLANPLALYTYMKDIGGFDTEPKHFTNKLLKKWRTPKCIRRILDEKSKESCAANTYLKTDEPAHKAFDNLKKNESWMIK